MRFRFDPAKDARNFAKHGISLAQAELFEWDDAVRWLDQRRDYGESRQRALGYIGNRLFSLVFVARGEELRVISLRKANKREEKAYAET